MPQTQAVRHLVSVPARRLITLASAALQLHVTVPTVRGYIGAGYLVGYRLGERLIRVDQDEVDRLVREIPTWRRNTAAERRTAETAIVMEQARDAEADLQTRVRP